MPDFRNNVKPPLPPHVLEQVRERFQTFLKENNQRQTNERFAILDAVYAAPDHFDADELYFRLKTDGSSVSRATVYNTLDLLLDADLVVRHQFGKNQAKYERAYGYWQHDHLICFDCNEVFEFCDPRIQSIKDMVAELYQFRITHHALQFHGHCERTDCPNRRAA